MNKSAPKSGCDSICELYGYLQRLTVFDTIVSDCYTKLKPRLAEQLCLLSQQWSHRRIVSISYRLKTWNRPISTLHRQTDQPIKINERNCLSCSLWYNESNCSDATQKKTASYLLFLVTSLKPTTDSGPCVTLSCFTADVSIFTSEKCRLLRYVWWRYALALGVSWWHICVWLRPQRI